MGYKLGYHILVLPSQVLLIISDLTNKILLYICMNQHASRLLKKFCDLLEALPKYVTFPGRDKKAPSSETNLHRYSPANSALKDVISIVLEVSVEVML